MSPLSMSRSRGAGRTGTRETAEFLGVPLHLRRPKSPVDALRVSGLSDREVAATRLACSWLLAYPDGVLLDRLFSDHGHARQDLRQPRGKAVLCSDIGDRDQIARPFLPDVFLRKVAEPRHQFGRGRLPHEVGDVLEIAAGEREAVETLVEASPSSTRRAPLKRVCQ